MGPAGWLAVYTLIALSSASVVWFFQVRRSMLMRMRAVVGILEDVFRPRDKTYTLLGYLVGFRAVYRLDWPWAGRAWILYTMPPSHVFLYLPVVVLQRRRDRLEVTLRLASPLPGEAHVYDPGDRWARRLVARDTAESRGRLRERELELAGKRYRALYSGEEALSKAERLAQELLARGVDVRRVTLDDGRRALHVSLAPSLDTLREALETVKRSARLLAGS
ncbi:hypothetical protein CF15_07960 [Pyrodictium occultum]|uniref:Uncharacterized protein n=1 Tax=Pyrodictium occultum TaxID=2309 RepID=A0A0V8RRG6_PYROC|nr:hypothetical protein [Pyrodictium occultum]KSW10710.1 hypothetical protein CF15_07960 [Pyrodictium occultum]